MNDQFISRDINEQWILFMTDIVCFQKISRPHHGKNWKIKFWRGRELKGLRNSSGVRGLKTKIHFQKGTYNDFFAGTLAGFSGAFVGHAAFFLSFFSCKRLWFFLIKVVSKRTSLNKRWGLWLCEKLVDRIWVLYIS